MFEFFDTIIGYFDLGFQYFINIIKSLTMAVTFLQNSVAFPVALLPFLPGVIGSAVTITIAIYVVKFIINR